MKNSIEMIKRKGKEIINTFIMESSTRTDELKKKEGRGEEGISMRI